MKVTGVIQTNTILDRFVAINCERIAQCKKRRPLYNLEKEATTSPKPVSLQALLNNKKQYGKLGFIAEIKKASPSKGVLQNNISVAELANMYESVGVDGISVLAQPYKFNGSFADLKKVVKATKLPVLCKDFIFDPYQLYQARIAGASAVLLITSLLETFLLKELYDLAQKLSLDVLVETHTEKEIEKAVATEAQMIGVNARDLKTMEVDLNTARRMLPCVSKDKIRIAESGIFTPSDVELVKQAGADAVLIGTAIMESKNPKQKIKELLV